MTPRAALERGLTEMALALPAGAVGQLITYVELLAKWNRTYNLTAIRDPLQMVSRCPGFHSPSREASGG
jgi:16S rRNA (guanine527-N7)-methyltransferase